MAETRKERYQKLLAQLKNERSSYEPTWRDLNDFIKPGRVRLNRSDSNRNTRTWQKIIDGSATLAARTLSSGLVAGVSSPSRPWFRLTTPDPDMAKYGPVKVWLDTVREIMTAVLLKSNVYSNLQRVYGDMGTFATGAMSVTVTGAGSPSLLRFAHHPLGTYYCANDYEGHVRVFARELRMTVRQLVGMFAEPGDRSLRNFSPLVKNAWERGDYETPVDVVQVVEPNMDYDPTKLHSRFKQYRSCYYEPGGERDVMLEDRGFDRFPVLCGRWEVIGSDVYGQESPGWIALGDVKALQHGEKRGSQGLDKLVNPPLIAPVELQRTAVNQLPGGVTYATLRDGQKGLQPLYQVEPRLDLLEVRQEAVRVRVSRAYFEDLFLMLDQLGKGEYTATEVLERKQEKMLVLGPMLEQLDPDVLNPLIDHTFDACAAAGMLPPPPEEVEGEDLKVEYISVAHQAQKETRLAALDRFGGFSIQVASVQPDALDKIDVDNLLDEYAEGSGIAPRIIRSDDDVAAIREQREQQMQAQAAAEQASQLAPAAKDLSETNTEQPSALSALLGGQAA